MTHDATTGTVDDEISLEIVRMFNAPPALVFRVWSSAEHLVRWWGPKDFTVPTFKTDFREGGAWRACIRSPEGTDHGCSGTYREIVAPERIVFTFRWEQEDALDTLVAVTFEDVGGRTRLTFRQTPFRTVADRDSHVGGWSECLDRLATHINNITEDHA